MHDKIQELARQAGLKKDYGSDREYLGYFDWREFAELIVMECAVYCEGHILQNDLNYNDGVMDCAIGLKQHFGIRE
jgi:hypothetical protein